MRFVLPDEVFVVGRSYAEVVERMAGHKLVEPRSIVGYRNETARRAKDIYGVDIDPTNDKTFVTTLVAAGLMRRAK